MVIEGRLDQDTGPEFSLADVRHGQCRGFVACVLIGWLVTVLFAVGLSDRRDIFAQVGGELTWSPIGAVTLHDRQLQTAVRAMCQGQTRLRLTLQGQGADAKTRHFFLLDCIF